MIQHGPNTATADPAEQTPITMRELVHRTARFASLLLAGACALLVALKLLGSESIPGAVITLMGCLGLISCRVWFLCASREQKSGVQAPDSLLDQTRHEGTH